MRVKEFFFRTGLFLPITLFATLIVLMLIGIAADLLGANSIFFEGAYCYGCLGVFLAAIVFVVSCQFFACWRKK